MSTDLHILDLLDSAVTPLELGLRRVADDRWERRSAQVWYRVWGKAMAENHVEVNVGLVIPLIDRLVARADDALPTVRANLLQLAGAGNERSFELIGSSRRGKLAARLRAPVLGTGQVRHVPADQFSAEVSALLTQHYLPWGRLTTWAQLAELFDAKSVQFSRAGMVDDAARDEGILRWASGDRDRGLALIGHDLELTNALEKRFAQLAS